MLDVAVVLVRRNGALLFLEREREPMRGSFELPGGKIEPGETPEAAAARELAEETGLVATGLVPLEVATHAYPWGEVRLHVFEASVDPFATPSAGSFRDPSGWALPDVLPATRDLLRRLPSL